VIRPDSSAHNASSALAIESINVALPNDRYPPFAVIPLHLMFTTRAVSKQTESFSSRDPAVRPESVIRSDRIPL